jgi:hypothetical protein
LVFSMSFVLDFYFEKQQFMFVKILKNVQQDSQSLTVGRIMGTRAQNLSLPLGFGNSENLVISADKLENSNQNVILSLTLSKSNNPGKIFYVIKKLKSGAEPGSKNPNDYYKIAKSNSVLGQGRFNDLRAPATFLCNGKLDHPLVIEFHSASDQTIIGQFPTSVTGLQNNANFNVGGLSLICQAAIQREYTFIEYLRGGLQISLSIAIDFTGSNGNPNNRDSLHAIRSDKPNQYQSAIRACGDILAYYDYDNSFPVFGYGAKLPGQYSVSDCFPLNLTQNPYIQTIDGVLDIYCKVMPTLNFHGPTNFAPVIRMVVENINNMNTQQVYHCLLIITDGEISDMRETTDALIDASHLPLSVVIVGVGESDFANMNELDCDGGLLTDMRGKKAIRDLVQFVPFKDFLNNPPKLAEQVLAEIPRQLVDHMRIKGIPPREPINVPK